MGKRLKLTGQKFGRLTVIKISHKDIHGTWRWLCRCDCGNEKIISSASLKNGNTKSCGCLHRLELTGQRFGRFTVIEYSGINKQGGSSWLCKCDCGNEKIISGIHLKNGETKSCGCIRQPDLIGQRFGKLTVLEYSGINKGNSYWLCKCDCGNEKVIRGANLKNGSTKSCDCLWKFPGGMAARNAAILVYKQSAKNRGLEWDLTDEQAIALFEGNCHYSGTPPSNVMVQKGCNGSYTYSGIDRIDNNKGYTIDNVVSCSEDCNGAKGELSYDEFLDLIKRIHSNLKLH